MLLIPCDSFSSFFNQSRLSEKLKADSVGLGDCCCSLLLLFCCTKGNFHISSCYKFEFSCSKHIAILFRALREQSFPSDCVSMLTFPVNCQSRSNSRSRYSKWSNKALPLQSHHLAFTWAAYMILKIGLCEIMLTFVQTRMKMMYLL